MRIVAIVSGGMDSVTLAHRLRSQRHTLYLLSVDYGQRHRRELEFARACAARLGAAHRVVDLTSLTPLLAGSSLTDPSVPVPEGHYADETMRATVVPNRNMILLSVAAAWAVSLKAQAVAIGVHSGDHAVYPDCRPEFAAAMDHALSLCDWHPIRVERPFVAYTKSAIVQVGTALGVPYEETWSCYKGGERHCGRCGTCVERREAFELAGVPDPTTYES